MIISPTKYLNKVNEQVSQRVPEQVLAVALLQPQTALVPGQSKHEVRSQSKRSFVFAVTPTTVHVFGLKDRGYVDTGRVKEEIAVWRREGLRIERGSSSRTLQAGEGLDISLGMQLITLHMADGFSVTLGMLSAIPMKGIKEMWANFEEALATPV